LIMWKYKAQNSLMYEPAGAPLTPAEEQIPGPPKEIVHSNTRLEVSHQYPYPQEKRPEVVWGMLDQSTPQLLGKRRADRDADHVDLDDLFGTPSSHRGGHSQTAVDESPMVGGYRFVATPSPAPGVDMSPFTTWGSIRGTPVLLDPSSTPGPVFKLPETPRREKVALELTEKTGQKMRQKRARFTPTHISSLSTPPSTIFRNSRTTGLSPLGQRMIGRAPSNSGGKSSFGSDQQLRASYSSPLVKKSHPQTPTISPHHTTTATNLSSLDGTPSKKIVATPVVLEPTTPTKATKTTKMSTTTTHPSIPNENNIASSVSLTDNLLNI